MGQIGIFRRDKTLPDGITFHETCTYIIGFYLFLQEKIGIKPKIRGLVITQHLQLEMVVIVLHFSHRHMDSLITWPILLLHLLSRSVSDISINKCSFISLLRTPCIKTSAVSSVGNFEAALKLGHYFMMFKSDW